MRFTGPRFLSCFHLELQLWHDITFPVRFGRKVIKAGGNYSRVNPNDSTRFVHLPLQLDCEWLIESLLAAYPGCTVIFRNDPDLVEHGVPAWVIVLKTRSREAAQSAGPTTLHQLRAKYDSNKASWARTEPRKLAPAAPPAERAGALTLNLDEVKHLRWALRVCGEADPNIIQRLADLQRKLEPSAV